MERIFEETWGNGFLQKRTVFINTFQHLAVQGFFQLPVFYGQVKPHLCDENNEIVEKYVYLNDTDTCQWDCAMKTSYVNDLGLICKDAYLQQFVMMFILLPNIFGCLLSGPIMDTLGRRKTLCIFGLSTLPGAIGLIFTTNYYIFSLCGSVIGFSISCLGSYTLPMELMPPKKRWMVGPISMSMWGVGTGWLTLTSFIFRDWRTALQINTIPLLVVALYPILLPESPRWLLRQGRLQDAIDSFKYIANVNGVTIEDKHIEESITPLLPSENSDSGKSKDDKFGTIFSYPRVLTRFIILIFINVFAVMFWFTIVLQVGIIHCCIYVTYTMFFILESPVRMLVSSFLMPRIRRKGIYGCLVLSAVLFIATSWMNDHNTDGQFDTLKLVTGLTAKFINTCYYAFAYTMMSEIHPTGIRQTSTSIQIGAGAIGAMLAPMMIQNIPAVDYLVPVFAIVTAQLVLVLPSILDKKLPDTFDEASRLKDEGKSCCTY